MREGWRKRGKGDALFEVGDSSSWLCEISDADFRRVIEIMCNSRVKNNDQFVDYLLN